MKKKLLTIGIILTILGISLIGLNYFYYQLSGGGSNSLDNFAGIKPIYNPFAKYFYPAISSIIVGIILVMMSFFKRLKK